MKQQKCDMVRLIYSPDLSIKCGFELPSGQDKKKKLYTFHYQKKKQHPIFLLKRKKKYHGTWHEGLKEVPCLGPYIRNNDQTLWTIPFIHLPTNKSTQNTRLFSI